MKERLLQDRLVTQLVSFFGVLLCCLRALAFMGDGACRRRRTNEIGIRMALGAGERTLSGWFCESLVARDCGLLIGIPTALVGARFVSSQLFGLNASDPLR
jgi:hypothetical protein